MDEIEKFEQTREQDIEKLVARIREMCELENVECAVVLADKHPDIDTLDARRIMLTGGSKGAIGAVSLLAMGFVEAWLMMAQKALEIPDELFFNTHAIVKLCMDKAGFQLTQPGLAAILQSLLDQSEKAGGRPPAESC